MVVRKGQIKKFSTKRAALERKYRALQQEIFEEREPVCAGCNRGDLRLTFSHRIPRSRNIELLIDKDNIDLMCHGCHEKVELGRFDELMNGEEIKEYLMRTDLVYYNLKTL